MLVLTPRPRATESMYGYISRLSAANSLGSPQALLSLAGASPRRWLKNLPEVINQLSALVGHDVELAKLAYHREEGGKYKTILLGHSFPKNLLRLKHPQVCPECVKEDGFVGAQWDSHLVIACPRHRRYLIKACSGCGKRLSAARRAPSVCTCGHDFAEDRAPPAPAVLCDLMAIVIQRILRAPVPHANPSRLPDELKSISVHALHGAIYRVGRFAMAETGKWRSDPGCCVLPAAEALADWPLGLERVLTRLDQRAKRCQAGETRFLKRYESLYTSLFKAPSFRAEMHFVKKAFVSYGLSSEKEHIDPRIAKVVPESARLQSRRQFAKVLGVMPGTLHKMLQAGLVKGHAVRRGGRQQVMFKVTAQTPKRSPGKSLGDREAARYVGVPVSLLLELRASGHLRRDHLGTKLKSFHEKDLEDLKARLLRSADRVEGQLPGTVRLGYVLARPKSVVAKAKLVRALLDGALQAQGRNGDSVESILVPCTAVACLMARTSLAV